MSQPFTINVTGLKELQERMQKAPAKIAALVGKELKFGALSIASEAKQRAPGDQGILRNEIGAAEIDQLNYEVVSGASYSAWVEFGTRTLVEVPPDLAEFAAQFIGQSGATSLSAKEAIYAWCARHGIEEKFWYSIYVKLMTVGMKAQPFFFPAVERERPIILENVARTLQDVI